MVSKPLPFVRPARKDIFDERKLSANVQEVRAEALSRWNWGGEWWVNERLLTSLEIFRLLDHCFKFAFSGNRCSRWDDLNFHNVFSQLHATVLSLEASQIETGGSNLPTRYYEVSPTRAS